MQYYTFELDKESQELCVIITPFGKYKYKRLPMGLKCAPDFAHKRWKMSYKESMIMRYLDDNGCFPHEWKHHIKLLERVLTALQAKGFTIYPKKCEWDV